MKKALAMSDLHVRDYSPWEGWEVTGWPTTVILRGKTMVEEWGTSGRRQRTDKVVLRKVDQSVLQRPTA